MKSYRLKNILFVTGGNRYHGPSPIIKSQARSIETLGINVEFFIIKGKGISGYLKSAVRLYKFLRKREFDLIHAHYLYTGILILLIRKFPKVVSLMGSDILSTKIPIFVIRFFVNYIWDATIVKSNEIKNKIGNKKIYVIPNGVDLKVFKYINKSESRKKLNLDTNKVYICFVANDINRKEKNFKLIEDSIKFLNNNVDLIVAQNIEHDMIPYYLNSCNVLVLSSLYEGSPNVIKEAMACGCPIVTTDVGDVRLIIGNTKGCYISNYKPVEFANNIKKAINFSLNNQRTNGRERIIELGLDSFSISKKILNVYNKLIIQ